MDERARAARIPAAPSPARAAAPGRCCRQVRVVSSSVVGSIQCASSRTRRTGSLSLRPTISSTRSAMVAVLRWAGVNDNGGAGVSAAIEKSSASNGIAVSSARHVARIPPGAWRCARRNRRARMQRPRNVLDHRIEGAVAMIGRALQMNRACEAHGRLLPGTPRSRGFADTGLADHGDNLDPRPSGRDASARASAPFRVRGRRAAVCRHGSRQSGSRPPFAEHAPSGHRVGKSFQSVIPEDSRSNNPPSRSASLH